MTDGELPLAGPFRVTTFAGRWIECDSSERALELRDTFAFAGARIYVSID